MSLKNRLAAISRRAFEQSTLVSSRSEPSFVEKPTAITAVPSPLQEELWVSSQLGTRKYRNDLCLLCTFAADISLSKALKAVQEVLDAQSIFKHHFEEHDGTLRLQKTSQTAIEHFQLEHLSSAEIDQQLSQPTSMIHSPVRITWGRLSAGNIGALIVANHSHWDGASHRIFQRLVSDNLKGSLAAEIGGDFYEASHHIWSTSNEAASASARRFWRNYLSDYQPFYLQGDFGSTARGGDVGRIEKLTIKQEVYKKLKQLGIKVGTTLYPILATAIGILLVKYTEATDIVVGMTKDMRRYPEDQGLIGNFVQVMPVRIDMAASKKVSDLMRSIAHDIIDMARHKPLPYSEILKEVAPSTPDGTGKLVQVEVTLEDGDDIVVNDPVQAAPLHDGGSRFDLAFVFKHTDSVLDLYIEYPENSFEPATIQEMLNQVELVLDSIASDPDSDHKAHFWITDKQKSVLTYLAAREAKSTGDETVVDMFRQYASIHPEAPAIRFDGKTTTYGDLFRISEVICCNLLRERIREGEIVGVVAKRNPEMIAMVLAALMAGCCYVPIDPDLPRERVSYICENAQLSLLMVGTGTADAVREALPAKAKKLTYKDLTSPSPDPYVIPLTSPDALAYLIYTSGSTGTPKGVEIEHRALSSFVRSISETYSITSAEKLLGFFSFSFDVWAFEIFCALCNGATLCLATEVQRLDSDQLARLLASERVTVAELPPALLPLLRATDFPELKLLSVGGEVFALDTVRPWIRPGRKVFNGYGPTEATVAVVVAELDASSKRPPPIGEPFPGSRALVVSKSGTLAPMNCPGELWISGPQLARGYHGRPELTEERFTWRAFPGMTPCRYYRTGDRVRLRSSGQLEMLGRTDRQIKLRGHRIEPAEIEFRLCQIPNISVAAVVKREDDGLPPYLAAYVRFEGQEKMDEATLRTHLTKSLPSYMVPTVYVAMETLPLTTNGKVDFQALPPPPTRAQPISSDYESPLEKQIADLVFAPVLGVSPQGRNSDFFSYGGSSLQAMQALTRLRENFQVSLSLGAFYSNATISALADALAVLGVDAKTEAPSLGAPKDITSNDERCDPNGGTRDEHQTSRALNATQARLFRPDIWHSVGPDAHIPILLTFGPGFSLDKLSAALSKLQKRHALLRSMISESTDTGAFFSSADCQSLQIAEFEAADTTEQDRIIRRIISHPFNRENNLFWRAALVRIQGKDLWTLCLVFHHIIVDGWSVGVILADLADSYSNKALPETPRVQSSLPGITGRQESSVSAQISNWAPSSGQPYSIASEANKLPPTQATLTKTFKIDRDVTTRLRAKAQRLNATLNMVLLQSFARSINGNRNEPLLLITPTARRLSVAAEHQVDYFASVLPVVVDPSKEVAPAVEHIKQQIIAAQDCQEFSLEDLQRQFPEMLQIQQYYHVLFAFQDTPVRSWTYSGTEVTRYRPMELEYPLEVLRFYSARGFPLRVSLALETRGNHIVGRLEHLDDGESAVALQAIADRFDELTRSV